VLGRRRATGESKALTGRAGRKAKLAAHDEALRARVAAIPDATLEELQAWLATERKVEVSIGCLWNRLQRLKFPLKKKSQHAAEQARPDVAAARHAWHASQADLNPERLVFIDETGAATNMARRYGRCPRGQRLVAHVPWGHWKTITFVAACRGGSCGRDGGDGLAGGGCRDGSGSRPVISSSPSAQ
jgi:hypothetical protein